MEDRVLPSPDEQRGELLFFENLGAAGECLERWVIRAHRNISDKVTDCFAASSSSIGGSKCMAMLPMSHPSSAIDEQGGSTTREIHQSASN